MDENKQNPLENPVNPLENSQNSPESIPDAPVASPEAQQALPEIETPSDGSMAQETQGEARDASEMPQDVPEEQKSSPEPVEKPKKSHKKLVILLSIVFLLLVATGVGIWFFLQNNRHSESVDAKKDDLAVEQDKNSTEEDNTTAPELPVTDLSLDDPLIQETYGWFEPLSMGWFVDTLARFYHDEGNFVGNGIMSRDMMLLLASYKAEESECHAGYEVDYHDYLVQQSVAEDIAEHRELVRCLKGAELKAQMAKIFGQSFDLRDGDKIAFYGDMGVYHYYADFDEFVFASYGFGGASINGYMRYIQSAETKGDELYVYERVAEQSLVREIEAYDEQLGAKTIIGQVLKYTDLDGKLIYELEEYATEDDDTGREKMKEAVLEKGSLVKWTFKKNADGRYLFQNLQRL